MKPLTGIALATLLALAGCNWFARDTFTVPEPTLPPMERPIVDTGSSHVSLDVAVPLPELQAALNEHVDRTFSGGVEDPATWLTGDVASWRMTRGDIALRPGEHGELQVSVPIAEASATLNGRAGPARPGIPGSLREALGRAYSQTSNFGGVVNVRLSPRIANDWTIDPRVGLEIDPNRPDASLFGQALSLSLSSKIGQGIQPRLDQLVAQVNDRLRRDGRLRAAVADGWDRLNSVTRLSENPNVWLITSPSALAISEPAVDHGMVRLRLDVTLATAISVQNTRPAAPPPTALPPPGQPAPGAPGFTLKLPLSVRLADLVPPGGGATQTLEIPTAIGTIELSDIRASGDNGRIIVSAHVNGASPATRDRIRGRIYMVGSPHLDPATMTISADNLAYSLETRNMLLRSANWMLRPIILNQIRRQAVFSFAENRDQLITRANREIEALKHRLPAGVEADLSVRQLDPTALVVDDGWATLLVTASGPARLTVSGRGLLAR